MSEEIRKETSGLVFVGFTKERERRDGGENVQKGIGDKKLKRLDELTGSWEILHGRKGR